jgi:hypothetical protein
MQVYTLVVQNVVSRRELGIATAAIQFFRNIGSTIGTAVLGTVMTAQMGTAIQNQIAALPAEQLAALQQGGGDLDASGLEAAVLDPAALEQLPAFLVEPIRAGMGEAMHIVFLTAVPFVVAALLLSLFIKQVPLRETLESEDDLAALSEAGTTTGALAAVGAAESVTATGEIRAIDPESDGRSADGREAAESVGR